MRDSDAVLPQVVRRAKLLAAQAVGVRIGGPERWDTAGHGAVCWYAGGRRIADQGRLLNADGGSETGGGGPEAGLTLTRMCVMMVARMLWLSVTRMA